MLACCVVAFSLEGSCSLVNMQKEFLKSCALQQGRYSQDICKAFFQFDELHKSSASYAEYVNSLDIQKIFLEEELSSREQITAQLLLVVLLQDIFLKSFIKKINIQLQKIIAAKQYWIQCLISEPFLWNTANILKNKHISKNLMEKKIAMLKSLEDVQAELLGICLLSNNRLQKIKNVNEIESALTSIYDPFKGFGVENQISKISDFLKVIPSIALFIQGKQLFVDKLLKVHGIPQHLDRYFYAYSAMIATSLAGLLVWQKQKCHSLEYQEKAQRAFHGFLQDFLVAPLKGLKRAVWDRPDFGLKKFDLKDVPDTIWTCYTPERFVKYPLLTILHNVNKGIDVSEEIIKGQQINYYLSAIVPVFGGLYLMYKNGKYYYNHESYFKPMRKLLRDIDIFCNKLLGKQEMSLADYGFMYVFVSQLQKYVNCLNLEDRTMIEYDLAELISFEFTIEQKQKVIERMYRTYSFLK